MTTSLTRAVRLLVLMSGLLLTWELIAGTMLSGLGMRAVSANVAAAAATGFLLLVLQRTSPSETPPSGDSRQALFAVALFCACAALTFFRMWSPVYGPLVSTGGGDAGDHLYYATRIPANAVSLYNGIVSFHLAAWDLERITGWNYAVIFATLFWSGIATLIGAFALLSPLPGCARFRDWMFALAAIAISGELILLPILHILQGEGFYPQFWGMLAVMPGFLGAVFGRNRCERLGTVALAIVLYRFTYGLNLAELIATGAVVWISELLPLCQRRFAKLGLAAVILTAAAAAMTKVLCALFPLLQRGGATLTTNVAAVAGSTGMLAVALIFIGQAPGTDPRICRASLFAAVFAGTSAVFQIALIISGQEPVYYFVKYGLHPLWLATATVSFVGLPACIESIHVRRSTPVRSALLLCITGTAIAATGLAVYQPSYRSRSLPVQTKTGLVTFFEPEAFHAMSGVVHDRDLAFGGYMSFPNWALSGFMNAALGHAHFHQQPYYRTGAVRAKPGNCVFWDSRPEDLERFHLMKSEKAASRIDGLMEDGPVESFSYRAIESGEERQISFRCFPR